MTPRRSDAGKPGPHGTGELRSFFEERITPRLPTAATRRNHRTALDHLDRTLGRPAALADHTTENLAAVLETLRGLGRTPATLQKVRQILLAHAQDAFSRGRLDRLPVCPALETPPREPLVPWTLGELDRLFACARTLSGTVGDIPAVLWWTALLAVLLDTAAPR